MKKSIYAMVHDHVYVRKVPLGCLVIGINHGTNAYVVLTEGMDCRHLVGDRVSRLLRSGDQFTICFIRTVGDRPGFQRERISNINGEPRVDLLWSSSILVDPRPTPIIFASY
jgi:hypothetical protein